jgi:AraC-like DNA-binding protein
VPASSVQNYLDPYPYQAAIRAAELEFIPTAKGAFHAELTKIDLHKLWMQRGNESLPRVFHGVVSPKRAIIGFLSDPHQPGCRHCGIDVSPDEIIFNDQNEMHRQTIGPCRWGSLSLTPENLAEAGAALAGRPVLRPSVTVVIRPPAKLMSHLVNLHTKASNLAKTTPDILVNVEVARALENALIEATVLCLSGDNEQKRSLANQRHSKIMARFEEFLSSHQTAPVYLAEICAVVGASERTLRACCQEQLGMGPIKYLHLRRMHLARRALCASRPGGSTVTRIAADHGFWEFGRFSVEYRHLFGESPAATLNRRQG